MGSAMIAAILSTGTELTRGELTNSNSCWLAAELTQLDTPVTTILTVGDHRGRIAEAFQQLSVDHDVVICTGGLGPTTDDLTSGALAVSAGVQLETHEPSLRAIRERLDKLGRVLTDSNAKQAELPAGSTALPNHAGTAPGFSLKLNRATVYCLPGVPVEMRAMFEASVKPRLLEARGQSSRQIILRTFGMAESAVNDALGKIEGSYNVTVGYRVHFPELAVKIVALRDTEAESWADARKAASAVRELLGPKVVFGEGDATLPGVLGELLRERGQKIGLAESCTGGSVSALLAEQSGISDVLVGAIVAYSNETKERVLGVPRELIGQHGAVSREVALSMAEGAIRALSCDVSLAVTGIAGPTGETLGKPVGTVHFAVAGPWGLRHHDRVFRWERTRVQRAAAFFGLNWLRCLLVDPDAEPI